MLPVPQSVQSAQQVGIWTKQALMLPSAKSVYVVRMPTPLGPAFVPHVLQVGICCGMQRTMIVTSAQQAPSPRTAVQSAILPQQAASRPLAQVPLRCVLSAATQAWALQMDAHHAHSLPMRMSLGLLLAHVVQPVVSRLTLVRRFWSSVFLPKPILLQQ